MVQQDKRTFKSCQVEPLVRVNAAPDAPTLVHVRNVNPWLLSQIHEFVGLDAAVTVTIGPDPPAICGRNNKQTKVQAGQARDRVSE